MSQIIETSDAVPAAIRLGLPKGRMQKGVVSLLEDAGISVSGLGRGYRPVLGIPNLDTKVLKPQNIIEMLHTGSRDLGFAGSDWVTELGYDASAPGGLSEVMDTGLDPVRLVVAAPQQFIEQGSLKMPIGRPLRVAAEMPVLTRQWIDSKGIDATVVRTYGATEVFPPEDADCIVDIAATGETLRANGLGIVDTITTSSTRLFANATALENREKRERIESIVLLLRSVLEARSRVMLDLNVTRDRLDSVIEALPSLRQPTVAELRGDEGYAVRTAVPKTDIARLVPTLRSRGATDIVVSQPTQIVR